MSLSATADDATINLTWNASDGAGAGVTGYYDLDVSVDNNGTWQRLLSQTQDSSYPYTGDFGHSYTFRVTATDNVGNAGQGDQRRPPQWTVALLRLPVGDQGLPVGATLAVALDMVHSYSSGFRQPARQMQWWWTPFRI